MAAGSNSMDAFVALGLLVVSSAEPFPDVLQAPTSVDPGLRQDGDLDLPLWYPPLPQMRVLRRQWLQPRLRRLALDSGEAATLLAVEGADGGRVGEALAGRVERSAFMREASDWAGVGSAGMGHLIG